MRSMPPTFGAASPAAPVRLDGPAERIRTAVERRRPALSPRALDATACSLASMYGEAYGHMATLGARSERVTQDQMAGGHAVTLEDLAELLHRDTRAQRVAMAGLRALLASVGWEARPASFGLAALPDVAADGLAAVARFVGKLSRAQADGAVDAHEAADMAPDAEQAHVLLGVAHTACLRTAGGSR